MSLYSDAVLADSPLLYLRLDETSGSTCANAGSLGGNATANGTFTRNVTAAHANLGVAVFLPGVGGSDYISYPDTSALDLTADFTYECWINTTGSVTAGATLISKGRDNSSTIGYQFTIPSVGTGAGLGIRAGTGGSILTVSNAVSFSAWHHVVATRNSNTFTLYVDGSSVGSTSSSPSVSATTQPLVVGIQKTEFGVQNDYGGSIDEVAVYNTALTSTRVAAHYAAYNAAGAPNADFTGTPLSGTAPLTVAFTDTSTGTPTSWAWSFGDGTTSTSQNPSHSYPFSGTFPVSLVATNTGGSDTETKTGYVTVTSEAIVYAAGGGIDIW